MSTERFEGVGEEFDELNEFMDDLEAKTRRRERRVREESIAGASLICGLFAGLAVHLIITAVYLLKKTK